MADAPKRGRVWATSIAEGQCKGCKQPIVWVQFCKSGKRMPLDKLVVLAEGRDETTRLKFQVVNLEFVHWASCPQAKDFKRAKPAAREPAAGPLRIAAALTELEKAREALRVHYREDGGMQDSVISAGQALMRALNLLKGAGP